MNFNQALQPLLLNKKKLLDTESVCPICKKHIPASIVEIDGRIFIEKKCKEGFFRILFENDAGFFKNYFKLEKQMFSGSEWPFLPTEKDWKIVRRTLRTIILKITTHCNSNCNLCFEEANENDDEMSKKDIENIIKKIGKNKNVILWGGEPTTRYDIFEIIKMISKHGNIPMIFTNGLKLSDLMYVKKLKESGLRRVHLSFDGFNEEIYDKLRGNRNHLYLKLKALKNLETVGIETYLSATIVGGINESEVPKILSFAIRNNHFIKFIFFNEAVPWGRFYIDMKKYLTASDIIKLLEKANLGTIRREYIIEFMKLKLKLVKLFGKFHFNFPSFVGTLFKVKNNRVEELIPLKVLKKMNKNIDEGKYVGLLRFILKNINFTKFFEMLLERRLEKEILGDNILSIQFNKPCTPLTYLPYKTDSIEIRKSFEDKLPRFQYAGSA